MPLYGIGIIIDLSWLSVCLSVCHLWWDKKDYQSEASVSYVHKSRFCYVLIFEQLCIVNLNMSRFSVCCTTFSLGEMNHDKNKLGKIKMKKKTSVNSDKTNRRMFEPTFGRLIK